MKRIDESIRFRDSAMFTLFFILLLWVIKVIETTLEMDFGSLGIYPRTLTGTIGIVTGPLIHGDFFHLISNTFPIAILGIGIIYFYREIAHIVIGLIYLLSGFWVWLIAREAYHIGASGIVYGMMFFLLISGIIKKDKRQLAISFVILLLYGGSMFSGLFPTRGAVSWEAHSMGAVAGIFCAFLFRNSKVHVFDDSVNHFSRNDEEDEVLSHTGTEEFYYKIEYRNKEDKKG